MAHALQTATGAVLAEALSVEILPTFVVLGEGPQPQQVSTPSAPCEDSTSFEQRGRNERHGSTVAIEVGRLEGIKQKRPARLLYRLLRDGAVLGG